MNKNLSQSSQDKSNNYSPSQFTNAVKPKHYGLTYKERHSPSRRKSGHNGVPQTSCKPHKCRRNRKTFSPSQIVRADRTVETQIVDDPDNIGRRRNNRLVHAFVIIKKNRHDVQQEPHENPNLRLQSIDDIPDVAVMSKSPKNHKSKDQHVNKSKLKSPPPSGAAMFQFPLWNRKASDPKPGNALPNKDLGLKANDLRDVSSTTTAKTTTSRLDNSSRK